MAEVAALRLFADSGLALSLGEARRLIRGSDMQVSDVPLKDEAAMVTDTRLRHGAVKLSADGKQHRLLRVS